MNKSTMINNILKDLNTLKNEVVLVESFIDQRKRAFDSILEDVISVLNYDQINKLFTSHKVDFDLLERE